MTKARIVILLALAMGLIVLLAHIGQAQTFRGRIQGIVTDESKAVVINATVTVLNVNTGIKFVRQTSDTGLFVFDNVEPGTYSLTVENTGFNKFLQENVLVQGGGDVTVNAVLKPGSVQTTVTVNEAPPAVEFNSSNRESTLDQKMAEETPRLDRNSFKLGLLSPSAVNTRGENQPYNSWGPNSVDLGGGTNLQNELEVDGSPIGLGHKASVIPNVDAVQEVVVSTNSTDAESGHSAGGAISVTTKSGTNEWHGSGFYLGRYPWASVEADRTLFSANAERRNMYGGTLGNPILKNKLFNFFSMEYWKISDPNVWVETLPTTLEKQGDFSQSHWLQGAQSGIRTIYDPYTMVTSPGGTSASATAFANNIIPAARFDPITASLVSQFWAPNNPGADITGVNNFEKGYAEVFNYYDYSDRADYNISDKWKVFGRVSRYHTTDSSGNPTGTNTEFYVPTGTLRTGWQASGDAIWTINPRTVMSFHGDWRNVIDAYVSTPLASGSWASIWPNNPWYTSYQNPQTNNQPVYFPALYVNGNLFGGHGFYWNQRPAGQAYNAKISHQAGSHFLKAGFEVRAAYGLEYVNSAPGFNFNTALTANTYINPNTNVSGDPYATYLLGTLDGSSTMYGGPAPDSETEFYGVYFQDDWKLSRRITLNLGIRDDYETAWHDPPHDLATGLNLSVPNPAITGNPPVMPAAATSIVGSNFYSWNGQWNFTSSSHPGMWNPQKLALQPRAGIAFKIDDKTALRAGYALYIVPTEFEYSPAPPNSGAEDLVFLEPPFYGMSGNQSTLSPLQGIPQETFSNPYPAATNPLNPILGRNSGPQLGVGGSSLVWYPQNLQKPYNNRFNVTFQHELPGQIVVSGTYFLNLGDRSYTQELNGVNPQFLLNNESTINNSVPNPFYHYLTPTLNPGPLYNEPTVSVWSLLSKYPQYGPLFEVGACCAAERYNSVELKAQKMFSKGYNFLLSYVYINERAETNQFNDQSYYNNEMIWEPSNQPRNRLTGAGTYEFPFGKGRTYLNTMNRVGDAVIGGWQLTGVATFVSGDYPQFGNMIATGNPCIGNPTPGNYFNTSVFQPISSTTPYVLRTNPLQYDCLTGPKYFDLDGSLAKTFRVTEKVRIEFKMTAYNAINRLNRGDPNTNIYSSQFGTALYQGAPGGSFGPSGQGGSNYASGRQVEFGLKVKF
jgi:hypothetical protein